MRLPIPEASAAGAFAVAQLGQTDAGALFSWIGTAAFLLLLANQGFVFWKNLSGGLKEIPPPSSTYQTLTMCETLHETSDKKIFALETQLDTRVTGLARTVHELRLELKDDIKEMRKGQEEILKSLIRLEGVKS